MNAEMLKYCIESLLMAAPTPLSMKQLCAFFKDEAIEEAAIRTALDALQSDYQGRSVVLCKLASGFRFQVREEYGQWVARLSEERPPRYSRALLEILAIIVYRQPVTRGEIEDIRGVAVNSAIIKTLMEREWIKVVGHRELPGRPELLATTRQFLDYFNLRQLSELPAIDEIKARREEGHDQSVKPAKKSGDRSEFGGPADFEAQARSRDRDAVDPDRHTRQTTGVNITVATEVVQDGEAITNTASDEATGKATRATSNASEIATTPRQADTETSETSDTSFMSTDTTEAGKEAANPPSPPPDPRSETSALAAFERDLARADKLVEAALSTDTTDTGTHDVQP